MPYIAESLPPPSVPPPAMPAETHARADAGPVRDAATDRPGPRESGASSPELGRRIPTDLEIFVGFVGGALVGLAVLELGFWRTIVIGGCGALGVFFIKHQHRILTTLRGLF